jgi:hypothetical protein
MQIQVCTNHGPQWSGHNRENYIYMIVFMLKKMFTRTSKPISIKLGTNHLWFKMIKKLWKCQVLFKVEIFTKMQKWGGVIEKSSLREPQVRIVQIYLKASWHSAESILLNSWSPGIWRGHNRVKHFYVCFNRKSLKIFSRNHWAKNKFKFT